MPQPRPNQQPDIEPIERLKNLIGFKWSTILLWLIGLIPASFFLGYKVGSWVTNSDKKIEINSLTLKHQQEIFEAKEKGREEAIESFKQVSAEAKNIVEIIKQGKKKK